MMLCLTIASTAVAKDMGSKKAKKLAKQQFKQGQMHYKLGRFDDALASFSKAYETMSLPAFLFNIGQCHRNLKNWERSVFFFEGYLRELPNAPNRKVVEELIKEGRAEQEKVDAAQRAAEELRLKEEALRIARERAEIESQATEIVAVTTEPATGDALALAPIASTTEVESEAPIWQEAWFWGIVGGAVLVVGGVVAIVALSGGETQTKEEELPQSSLGTTGGALLSW